MNGKILVLGNGAFSLSIAADLMLRGADVGILSPGLAAGKRRVSIVGAASAAVEIPEGPIDRSTVPGAGTIIINTAPPGCGGWIDLIAPYLRNGQRLVLFPSGFMTPVVRKRLAEFGRDDVTVCELVSSPAVCELEAHDVVRIFKYKNELKLSVSPSSETGAVLSFLNGYLPMFRPARNFIETSLENINSILHPLPILLNLVDHGRKGKDFLHFIDGINPTVSTILERMDEERLRIGKAYSLELMPALEHLKNYYGRNERETIYEYIRSPECPYNDIRGFGLDSRYIREDIPYLLVPTSRLARAAGVDSRIFDACIDLGSAVSGCDFRKTGLDPERIGLEGMGADAIPGMA